MKIGVISSYAYIKTVNNYGALLQYFALQQYLQRRGHEAFWIKSLLPHSKLRVVLRHVKNYRSLRLLWHYYQCHGGFMRFVDRHLRTTPREYVGNAALLKDGPAADWYITGSDQVWGGNLKENYLRFVPDSSRKIAYAASFGRDRLVDDIRKEITPWVREFRAVSVREASGVDICEEMGVKARHLLDPTLLISSADYPAQEPADKKPRLFCYFINVSSAQYLRIEELKALTARRGLDLKISACPYSEVHFERTHLVFPSPEEWLGYYKTAEMIVTNTFHGTVFAIIYHRPFVTILQSGWSSQQNTRFLSLFKSLGLTDRIAAPGDDIEEVMNRPIDWERVEENIRALRLHTDAFFEELGL